MVSAILLAAGLSSRMGIQNKLLLPYRGKSIVYKVAEQILGASPFELIVVLGHEADRITTALAGLPVRFVPNEHYRTGMTGSIKEGISSAGGHGYMICLSDQYAITSAEYKIIINSFEQAYKLDNGCICIPRFEDKKGNPVIFSNAYRQDILNHNQPDGCRAIVNQYSHKVKFITMNESHILKDLDFPEDYATIDNS